MRLQILFGKCSLLRLNELCLAIAKKLCIFVVVPCIGFKTLPIVKLWGCLHCKGIYYIFPIRMTQSNKQQNI